MPSPNITIHVDYENDVLDSITVGDHHFENEPGSSADTIVDAIEYALTLDPS